MLSRDITPKDTNGLGFLKINEGQISLTPNPPLEDGAPLTDGLNS